MTIAALIVAAGRGTRAGGEIAKQWRPLAGKRVIDWTIAAFHDAGIHHIAVVYNPNDMHATAALAAYPDVIRAHGGSERAQSVQNGLQALVDFAPDKVLIHDAARPCIDSTTIHDVIDALNHNLAAAPAMPVTDALWVGASQEHHLTVTGTRDRDGLFAAQTPQGFDYQTIFAAHKQYNGIAADDVQVARSAGYPVTITAGNTDNIKITRPEDFARAEMILNKNRDIRPMDIRLGNGYDVHRFGVGDHVMLCGVAIPHARGLQGHSDADVGMHAVTDAIYGALAEGDIGRHFPPNDPQWKGAASDIFLRHAVTLARDKGFSISNVDCTLVCEFPKVGPHAAAMQSVMAEILTIDPTRVSIKATTSERLGFTGRGEGIAALATAALIKA